MNAAPSLAAPPALEIDGLWVNYGSVPAVRQLALTVGAREIVGLAVERSALITRCRGVFRTPRGPRS